MRKLIISALVLSGIIIGGATSFAIDDTGTKWQTQVKERTEVKKRTELKQGTMGTAQEANMIRGEITSISGNNVMIKDRMGDLHLITVTDPSTLSGLNIGDNVEVRSQSASISKVAGMPEENAPNTGPNEGSQP